MYALFIRGEICFENYFKKVKTYSENLAFHQDQLVFMSPKAVLNKMVTNGNHEFKILIMSVF